VITGNSAKGDGGGILNCYGPISHCTITSNSARSGGGLYRCEGPILNCIISKNTAEFGGGLYGGVGPVRNCLIVGNRAISEGGAVMYINSPIINCTIVGNSGPKLAAMYDCYGLISNCIVWGNSPAELYSKYPPTYSCIRGGADGMGNISDDPLFANPGANDYHLRPGSPCINAADPNFAEKPDETDIDGGDRVHAGRLDMGADEYHAERQSHADARL
jgi:hypothetical protein